MNYFYYRYNQKDPRFIWGIILLFIGGSIVSRTLFGTSLPIDLIIGMALLYFGLKIVFGKKTQNDMHYYD
jgi:hypothetical protein